MFSCKLTRREFIRKGTQFSIFISAMPLIAGCGSGDGDNKDDDGTLQVAMVADVHFHDVEGSEYFSTVNNGYTIRSLEDSVDSTRMFNENYFAFRQILRDLGEKGIKYICLVGDFSDDGQKGHIAGFRRVAEDSEFDQYEFEFFITPGNHDPCTPYGDSEDDDFLQEDGTTVSEAGLSMGDGSGTRDYGMWGCGYEEMYGSGYADQKYSLRSYGFMPKDSYVLYETPWDSTLIQETLDVADYPEIEETRTRYANKTEDYDYYYRGLKITNAADQAANGSTAWCPDSSYLAEPTEGLWICSVDMNVFNPKADDTTDSFKHDAQGWIDGITYKRVVLAWLKDVHARAAENGKTLIVFSHYPVCEYLNHSANDFFYLFDDGSYNNKRVPDTATAQSVLEQASMELNFSGHIHLNDTAVFTGEVNGEEKTMINVAIPSIAAYSPSYKIVKCNSTEEFEIQTYTLEEVEDFQTLFSLYETELQVKGSDADYLQDMLLANNYREFMALHTRVRSNRPSSDWVTELKDMHERKTGLFWPMMMMALDPDLLADIDAQAFTAILDNIDAGNRTAANLSANVTANTYTGDVEQEFTYAMTRAKEYIIERGYGEGSETDLSDFQSDLLDTLGFNELTDATYFLRNGDVVAVEDINRVDENAPTLLNYTDAEKLNKLLVVTDFFRQIWAERYNINSSGMGTPDWGRDYGATSYEPSFNDYDDGGTASPIETARYSCEGDYDESDPASNYPTAIGGNGVAWSGEYLFRSMSALGRIYYNLQNNEPALDFKVTLGDDAGVVDLTDGTDIDTFTTI